MATHQQECPTRVWSCSRFLLVKMEVFLAAVAYLEVSWVSVRFLRTISNATDAVLINMHWSDPVLNVRECQKNITNRTSSQRQLWWCLTGLIYCRHCLLLRSQVDNNRYNSPKPSSLIKMSQETKPFIKFIKNEQTGSAISSALFKGYEGDLLFRVERERERKHRHWKRFLYARSSC